MPRSSGTADRSPREPVIDRVAERIEDYVRLRTGATIRGLRVEVADDRVTLTGRTSTFFCKQLATSAALGVFGDKSLSNLIEVN